MMNKIVVFNNSRLQGQLVVSGAKNSALFLIAAGLLSNDTCVISNVPDISDVHIISDISRELGGACQYYSKTKEVIVNGGNISNNCLNPILSKKLRGSIGLIIPVLHHKKEVYFVLPGGDQIGDRPLDIMFHGLSKMGVQISYDNIIYKMYINKSLHGVDYTLRLPSHTATMLLMMMASTIEEKTILRNVSREPEIDDMVKFLHKMGAQISSKEGKIEIVGCSHLGGCSFNVMDDRLQIVTYILAALVTDGEIILPKDYISNIDYILTLIRMAGAKVIFLPENSVKISGERPYKPLDIITDYYPGFPTDLQAPMVAFLTTCNGISTMTESIFNNRFLYVEELKHLGATINYNSNNSIEIIGNQRNEVKTNIVYATDIRGGAALVIYALANSTTKPIVIKNSYHIHRGYPNFTSCIQMLGGNIIET